MGKKLDRFSENLTFSNLLQPSNTPSQDKIFELKGKWSQSYFGNCNPIHLELGCGKGEYTLYFATINPEVNHIGVDIKGSRLWSGAKTAIQKRLNNVAFLRTHIQFIDSIFGPEEVSQIWITFPDPQKKFRRTKKRLTSPSFLDKYRNILKSNNRVHLKTDDDFLFGYTLGIIENYNAKIIQVVQDVYKTVQAPKPATEVQTFYEQKFLEEGRFVKYVCFELLK